jgi:hypothetical protein
MSEQLAAVRDNRPSGPGPTPQSATPSTNSGAARPD